MKALKITQKGNIGHLWSDTGDYGILVQSNAHVYSTIKLCFFSRGQVISSFTPLLRVKHSPFHLLLITSH